jgi:hypothetical protein
LAPSSAQTTVGYPKEEPALSATFNAAMSQFAQAAAAVLPHHYPFDRFTTVADIGGGAGTLLAAILGTHRGLRGILFDTEEGVAQAGTTLSSYDVAIHTGAFFPEVPGGADLCLIKSVLHDWDDDHCVTILRNCRQAIPDDGRLLIVEAMLPDIVDGSAPPLSYLNDLNMLVLLGGRERTRAEFDTLCRRADFTLTEVIPLPPPVPFSVFEATPA